MAAALGAMVTRLAKQDRGAFEEDRRFFTEAVDRDAEAFQRVMAAYKRPKDERAPFVEEALHGAAEVPLEVLERAAAHAGAAGSAADSGEVRVGPGGGESADRAAKTGVLENVRINLDSIADADFKSAAEARVGQALATR